MEKQNYIGRKVKGFSFEDGRYNLLAWNSDMQAHIGEVGVIEEYYKYSDCFGVKFKKGKWNYPALLIEQHLVKDEEDQTELMDKLAMSAMNGILSAQVDKQGNGMLTNEREAHSIAKESYLIADAMLKARKEVSGE